MRPLRLAVDIKSLALHQTGIAVYLANLLALLATPLPDVEITLIGPRSGLDRLASPERFRYVPLELPRGPVRIPWYDQVSLSRAVARSGVDALFSPNCDAPVASPRPVMLTIHDLAYHRFANAYPWSIRTYYGGLARWHLKQAALVITDSAFSADELTACVPGVSARLAVVPGALDRDFLEPLEADAVERWRQAAGLPARYVVYTGGFDARKNVATVVAGVSAWADRHGEPVTLVITDVGRADDRAAQLSALAGRHVGLRVIAPLPRRDMPYLYRAARALVYLSHYEGFSLPVLEALAVGLPIVASPVGFVARGGVPGVEIASEAAPETVATALDRALSPGSTGPEAAAARIQCARAMHDQVRPAFAAACDRLRRVVER